MIEDNIIQRLTDLLIEIDMLEKQYRDEYICAVDIDDINIAMQKNNSTFEKIRKVKEWKEKIELLKNSINEIINLPIKETNATLINNENSNVEEYIRKKINNIKDFIFSHDEIMAMTSVGWSKKVLGLNHPFLRMYRDNIPISKQVKDKNGYDRYWNEVFIFGYQNFLVTSLWSEQNLNYFDKWYNSIINKKNNGIVKKNEDNI